MRLVISDFVSLDGVAQAPGGPRGGHRGWLHQRRLVDAVLRSRHHGRRHQRGHGHDERAAVRRTWKVMAAAWPARAGDPFADRMNEIDKYVVSRTLTEDDLSWRNTALLPADDLIGAV